MQIRESLDTNTEFPRCSPRNIATTIVQFLAALQSPLLPPRLYPTEEIDRADMGPIARRFLAQLAPLNYTVFVYVITFLREALQQQAYNRTNPTKLALICLDCMTPSINDVELTEKEVNARTSQQKFILPLLTYLLVSPVI